MLAETGSTNDDLAAWAREGAPEGAWLRAGRQSGGRGRQGKAWLSPEGNLYASTLVRLRPGDPPAPTLALVAAVGLHEAVAAVAPEIEAAVKWPNDLVVRGAKISGILLERSEDAVVLGFGVNLSACPEVPDRPATSLAAVAGGAPAPEIFLETLSSSFARWLARWRGEGLGAIRRQWLAVAHPPGTALSVGENGARIQGLFDGLDEDGALRLRLVDGRIHIVHAGDVFLI